MQHSLDYVHLLIPNNFATLKENEAADVTVARNRNNIEHSLSSKTQINLKNGKIIISKIFGE